MLYSWCGERRGKLQLSFSIKVLGCFLWEMSQLLDNVFNVPQQFETAERKTQFIRNLETFLALNASLFCC